ncbi:MAG: aminodeoxychorismate synthase component I [Planctomycetaceae bacterium]|jgi:para-aminobenzoate synthetase component I|nr:aminodeoxychorismate synthase component I [Planctomycetaceae bacterium]MBT6497048.1 aminodeoxychorismate synthase component I [Planctomycetaceae bacterium]
MTDGWSPPNAVGEPLVEELTPRPDVADALRAVSGLPNVLLLESARSFDRIGRYSYLTADPFAFFEIQQCEFGQDPFASVRDLLQQCTAKTIPGLPTFQGGAAGLLSYDLGHAWERLQSAGKDEFQMPAMAVGLYDWVIVWDHVAQRAWVISHGFPETNRDKKTDRASVRLRQVVGLLKAEPTRRDAADDRSAAARPLNVSELATQFPAPGPEGLTSNFSRDGFLRAVERVIEYIYAGDIFQANLSQRLLFPERIGPLELYQRMRLCNPAPFAGYFTHDDWAIVSASPERFVAVQDGEVETRPIKGTRQRRSGPEADLFTRDELRQSGKDQAENVMIVDLLRNDLSRVCRPGTIRVPSLCHVETYETVQHLVSEVRGRLDDENDVWDLLAAAFPGGSITGAPKVRAMEIIAELEPTARGPYCGSLFYVGFDGAADSNILIRTFTCRRGWIQCPVGGGIVAQSDPIAEYEETLHKAEGMLRALQ